MIIVLSILLMMVTIAALFFAVTRTLSLVQYRKRKRKKNPEKQFKKGLDPLTYVLYGLAVICFIVALVILPKEEEEIQDDTAVDPPPVVEDEPEPEFKPESTASSDPDNWGIVWEVFSGGAAAANYIREQEITFEDKDYFALPGIATFRGNNYRDSATYGTADVTEEVLETLWTSDTGTLEGSTWSGSGWTGQPLVVQWDEDTRQIMNLYDEKKAKDGLTEVIYATLDGHIYFLDIDDGSYTRDPLDLGFCFKGAGALDPRGYPIMYVGAGDENSAGEKPRMFIISLVDSSVLYEGGSEDSLALRTDNGSWCAFDSSPLVDAETDTLIWPGENGLLYTIKLNTQYSKEEGTLTISPDAPVIARYSTSRTSAESYWYGFEASAVIVDEFLYVSENGGFFYCVDLNTMELVWAQDTEDDSNSSPVFERISVEEGYVYTAPSLHWTADENSQGTINIFKLDAVTGEIVWKVPYEVNTVSGVSGGVQSSPLLGKEGTSIEGLIIYTIARTPTKDSGIMVALDTETGQEVWRLDMDAYTWSSPVAVYEPDGTAYIAVCDAWGYVHLVNDAGVRLYTANVGYLVEASPVVYNGTLIIGTRGEKIYALKIK